MDLADVYARHIEGVFDDPDALMQIEQDLERDRDLDDRDRAALEGRVGTYLADLERESGESVEIG